MEEIQGILLILAGLFSLWFLYGKFIKKDKKNVLFFKKTKDKNYFSLGKYIHHQLKALDIKNIDVIKKDTFVLKNNFFSARRSIRLNENDYGLLEDPFQENMVFTVEPGIYIPKEGFGIRLEDDVVIQSKGEPLNLMSDIPIKADEIEDIMNG